MLTINGETGEGGGQVLRTCLALSICLDRPFRIKNIRARRRKPGLQAQHLAAVNAAADISRASVQGNSIGSQELVFTPTGIFPGQYRFAIGTAGSATLVAQTVLPALMIAGAPSALTIEGGTHNPLAPTYDFFAHTFCSIINSMGPKVTTRLERPGFFPKGGGIMQLDIIPSTQLTPLVLIERGEIKQQWAEILLAQLPVHIAQREQAVIECALPDLVNHVRIDLNDSSAGPGNVVSLFVKTTQLTTVFTNIGQRGVPAETVATNAVTQLNKYLLANVPVDTHLADQLLVPIALAGAGEFITGKPSLHTTTNMEIINLFTNSNFTLQENGEHRWHISLA